LNENRFQNSESEIKSCDKSENNISIDPHDLFKEINFSPEKKNRANDSPIIHPINKFELNFFNEKHLLKSQQKSKNLFSPPKKIVYNYNTIKLQNNININFNNYYNVYTSSKPDTKYQAKNTYNHTSLVDTFMNSQMKNIKSNNQASTKMIFNSKFNNINDNRQSKQSVNLNSNKQQFTNFAQKLNHISSKVHFKSKNDITMPTNSHQNDDYFLSLFNNVQNKNKNIQLIADKVKKMSEKRTSKHSLIYNLNSNYKNYQEQSIQKRNFKEKLKDILISRKEDKNSLFDIEFNKKNHNSDSQENDVPAGKFERNHHSTEDIIVENNEFKKIMSKNSDNELKYCRSARHRKTDQRSHSLNAIRLDNILDNQKQSESD